VWLAMGDYMSYRSALMGSREKMQSGADMPLLRTITNIVGQSMWFKAIVALNCNTPSENGSNVTLWHQ
ncbi:hypothetical protein Tco_1251276, partial [Tanacetum coccineum]